MHPTVEVAKRSRIRFPPEYNPSLFIQIIKSINIFSVNYRSLAVLQGVDDPNGINECTSKMMCLKKMIEPND